MEYLEGQLSDIFVSYTRDDRDTATLIVNILERLGWTVFWDIQIEAGETWRSVIKENLEQAKCVVVLWSTKSINSQWVLDEAQFGASRNCLVPILIQGVNPPLGFGQIQATDLSSWEGTPSDTRFVSILMSIARNVTVPSELAAWKILSSSSQPPEIEAFLHTYPSGIFREAAVARLRPQGVSETETPPTPTPNGGGIASRTSSPEIESQVWLRIKGSRDIGEVDHFASSATIEELRLESRALADQLWRLIAESRSEIRLAEFLRRYPTCSYAAEARIVLLWRKISKAPNLADIENLSTRLVGIFGEDLLHSINLLVPLPHKGTTKDLGGQLKVLDVVTARDLNADFAIILIWRSLLHVCYRTKTSGGLTAPSRLSDGHNNLDFSEVNREIIAEHLQSFPNSVLIAQLQSLVEWDKAVAAANDEAIESFFVRYPLDGEQEEHLRGSLRQKRTRDQQTAARAAQENKRILLEKELISTAQSKRSVFIRRARISALSAATCPIAVLAGVRFFFVEYLYGIWLPVFFLGISATIFCVYFLVEEVWTARALTGFRAMNVEFKDDGALRFHTHASFILFLLSVIFASGLIGLYAWYSPTNSSWLDFIGKWSTLIACCATGTLGIYATGSYLLNRK